MNSSACRRSSSATIGRLRRYRRHHRNPDALALNGLHKRAEVAVSREQHQEIDVLGHLHCVDRKFDVHVAFDFSAAS